jgi:uncharacterized protein YneF (UPF0154 family)
MLYLLAIAAVLIALALLLWVVKGFYSLKLDHQKWQELPKQNKQSLDAMVRLRKADRLVIRVRGLRRPSRRYPPGLKNRDAG